jgi:hypothetical protein
MKTAVHNDLCVEAGDDVWAVLVDELFLKLFQPPRPVRSQQYKPGVHWALANRLMVNSPEAPMLANATTASLVEIDAYLAGVDEGARQANDLYAVRCQQVRVIRRCRPMAASLNERNIQYDTTIS